MKFNDSIELTKERPTDVELGHKNDLMPQLFLRNSAAQHKPYGKMVVLLQTDRILITLGPDYICFVITFIVFAVAGFFLTAMVNEAFDELWIKILNVLVVLTQQLSYLMVGLSNPGVALPENLASEETNQQDQQQTKRYCLKCKIRILKNMHHCKRCDVCIRGYDHHCPWVSKCIGASNIKRFYFFVSFTPFYIIYFMIMLLLSLAFNVSKKTMQQ